MKVKQNRDIIRIPKPVIFSYRECLHFLDRGYDDCLYAIEGDRVLKPFQIDGNEVLFQVTDEADALLIEILAGDLQDDQLEHITDYVSEWFDLERDLSPFYLEDNDRLSWMPDQFHGLRLMGIPDLFEALCWCVIGQQINLTFAYRLKRGLVETYGTSLTYRSTPYYYFPEPEQLADATVAELRELHLSRQKAEYLIGIAREFAGGGVDKKELLEQSGTHAMLEQLMRIRGVGEWTANYVLMKSLKQMDCITYGDTGLQSAVSSQLGLDRKPTRKEVETFFEPLSGWESYLVIYLWRTLS